MEQENWMKVLREPQHYRCNRESCNIVFTHKGCGSCAKCPKCGSGLFVTKGKERKIEIINKCLEHKL